MRSESHPPRPCLPPARYPRRHAQAFGPMRHHQHRAAVSDRGQPLDERALGLEVEATGHFIKQQDARLHDQRAGKGQAASLADRQIGAAFLQDGLVLLGQAHDEVVRRSQLRRRHHLIDEARRMGQPEIVG